MKIIKFKAENIQNLKVVEIDPKNNVVILTGKNEAGKSSILDAIEITLAGKKLEDPIRHGEKKAVIEAKLDEYTVRRVITEKTDRLEVLTAQGAIFKSPQGFLNKILGKLSFDPLEFAEMIKTAEGKRRQHKLLMDLVGINFGDKDEKKKELSEERLFVGREMKNLQVQMSAIPDSKLTLPKVEISMTEKLDELKELEKKQRIYFMSVDAKERLVKAKEEKDTEILWIENEIQELIKRKKAYEFTSSELRSQIDEFKLSELVEDSQIEEKRKEIETVESTNAQIRTAQSYRRLVESLNLRSDKWEELTRNIQNIEKDKQKVLQQVKFPIEGLGVNEDSVIFNETPFSQLSTGQQIKISTAIAMKLNPELRVILIREGSSLDSDNLKYIADIAKKKDYQIWIEKVDETGKVGVYIEDGSVKSIN